MPRLHDDFSLDIGLEVCEVTGGRNFVAAAGPEGMCSDWCSGVGAQERRSVAQEGLSLHRLTGADIKSSHWDAFYNFYIHTTGANRCQRIISNHVATNRHSPSSAGVFYIIYHFWDNTKHIAQFSPLEDEDHA